MRYDSTQPWPKGKDGVRSRVPFVARGFELVDDAAVSVRRRTFAFGLVVGGMLLMMVMSSLGLGSAGFSIVCGCPFVVVGGWILTARPVRKRPVLEPAEMIFYDDCLIVYMPSRTVVEGDWQARFRTFEYVARRNVERLVVDGLHHVVEVVGPTSVASVGLAADGTVDERTFVATYNSTSHPLRIHVRATDEDDVVSVLRNNLGGVEVVRA